MSIYLGREHGTGKQFYLPLDAFPTHCHFIGGTGKGKTTTLEAIQHQLFRHRENAAHFILDRMGAYSASLLRWFASPYCPQHVRDRLIYWNPAREDAVLPFNPLLYTTPGDGYFRVVRTCDCILRAWDNQNLDEMPRLARWLQNAMWGAAQLGLTVSDCSHLLLPGSRYHEPILNALPPLLKAEFNELQTARGEAGRMLEAPRNRLKPYIEMPILRNMFGSSTSHLDIPRMRREGKILLCNLAPQNRLPAQPANAIGGLILNEILATARSGETSRTYIWGDEFQNYVGPDMESAIPEVRQLGVRLILSHQSLSQLIKGDTDLTSIIWQLQSRLVFGVQGADADDLAHEFASLLYDPRRLKDEMYSRRQLLKGHQVIQLQSWSESDSAAENWQTSYGTNWTASNGTSHSDGLNHTDSRGISRRINDPLRDFTLSTNAADGRSSNNSTSQTTGTGGSQNNGEGGSRSHSTSRSVGESLLPIHEEFLELTRKTFFTFEEQRAEWARDIRRLKTGQALIRVVNDPKIYCVDVERHAPGYLEWDEEKIKRRHPEAIEAIDELIEKNASSEYFVSPELIERETDERLQRLLNPVIRIPASPVPGIVLDQAPSVENPMA